jgi:hypothetical protein
VLAGALLGVLGFLPRLLWDRDWFHALILSFAGVVVAFTWYMLRRSARAEVLAERVE